MCVAGGCQRRSSDLGSYSCCDTAVGRQSSGVRRSGSTCLRGLVVKRTSAARLENDSLIRIDRTARETSSTWSSQCSRLAAVDGMYPDCCLRLSICVNPTVLQVDNESEDNGKREKYKS